MVVTLAPKSILRRSGTDRARVTCANGLAGSIAAVALVVLAGCGDTDDGGGEQSSPDADRSAPTEVSTTAPLAGDPAPDCATEGGCVVGGNHQNEPGYMGPPPDATPADGATVDPTSLRLAEHGSWEALGLVTNGNSDGAHLWVQATLFDADDAEVAVVDAAVLVGSLRPGELGPFRISAEIDAEIVVDVSWEVLAGADGDVEPVGRRGLDLAVFWSRPFGDGERVEMPGYADPEVDPLPHLVYGSGTNRIDAALDAPVVVAAWRGPNGQVLAVTQAPLLDPGTSEALGQLAPASSADVVLTVSDPDVGPLLAAVEPILWGIHR